jgi:hypothetical protein
LSLSSRILVIVGVVLQAAKNDSGSTTALFFVDQIIDPIRKLPVINIQQLALPLVTEL